MVSATGIIVGIILVVTLLLLIFWEHKVHKTLVAMLGAGAALFFAILPGSGKNGEALIPDVDAIFEILEMDLILVIIGITLMVGVARTTGVFEYIALMLLKKTGDNQLKLLTSLSLFTLVFSAFLDAYMAILIVGSITIVSCDALDINPKPFILVEAMFGNLGGTMTRIASPPNLIIGGHYDIDFVTFFLLTAPYVLVVSIITLLVWSILFRKELSKKISPFQFNEILLIDERTIIKDPRGAKIAVIIMTITVLGFAIASFLPFRVELGYIALAGGFLMLGLIKIEVEKALHTIEWPLVFFLVGLLLIVGIVEETGLLELIALPIEILFSIDVLGGIIVLQWFITLVSSVIDNVPFASIMTGVLDSLISNDPSLGINMGMNRMIPVPIPPLLVTVVIGTNLGGNITPIGSASTVQAVVILERVEKKEAKISFLEFVKYGGIVTLFHLIVGSIYVTLLWYLYI
ncbi:MAG: SLC13 family permease [Candidatus Odinarchaeota archaeon]